MNIFAYARDINSYGFNLAPHLFILEQNGKLCWSYIFLNCMNICRVRRLVIGDYHELSDVASMKTIGTWPCGRIVSIELLLLFLNNKTSHGLTNQIQVSWIVE